MLWAILHQLRLDKRKLLKVNQELFFKRCIWRTVCLNMPVKSLTINHPVITAQCYRHHTGKLILVWAGTWKHPSLSCSGMAMMSTRYHHWNKTIQWDANLPDPTARMADCGGLMIAQNCLMPKGPPKLLMVNVPPCEIKNKWIEYLSNEKEDN